MRKLAIAFLFLCMSGASFAAEQQPSKSEPAEVKYEMTTYYLGLIYKGDKWTPEVTPQTQKIQEGHMANIRRLGAEGKLLLAGPFADNTDLRGIFVYKVDTLEEAQALVQTDPAVQAGRLRVELHPWFSAKNILVFPTAADIPGNAKH